MSLLNKDGKKGAALLIVSKLRGREESREAPRNENGDELDSSMGLRAAAEDMMRAAKADDVEMFMGSMKAFVEMVTMSSHKEE